MPIGVADDDIVFVYVLGRVGKPEKCTMSSFKYLVVASFGVFKVLKWWPLSSGIRSSPAKPSRGCKAAGTVLSNRVSLTTP